MPHLEFEARVVSVDDQGVRRSISGIGGIRVTEMDIHDADPSLFIRSINALLESLQRLSRGGMLVASPPEKPEFRELEDAVQMLKSGQANIDFALVEPRSVSGRPHKSIAFVFKSGA